MKVRVTELEKHVTNSLHAWQSHIAVCDRRYSQTVGRDFNAEAILDLQRRRFEAARAAVTKQGERP
jgi:hypothetical protein